MQWSLTLQMCYSFVLFPNPPESPLLEVSRARHFELYSLRLARDAQHRRGFDDQLRFGGSLSFVQGHDCELDERAATKSYGQGTCGYTGDCR